MAPTTPTGWKNSAATSEGSMSPSGKAEFTRSHTSLDSVISNIYDFPLSSVQFFRETSICVQIEKMSPASSRGKLALQNS